MKNFLATTAILVTLPFAANATTLTFTDSFGPALTDFATPNSFNPTMLPQSNPELSLSLFDTALGTLNSVQIMLTASFTSDGDVNNTSPNTETASAEVELDVFATSDVFAQVDLSAAADTGFQNYATGVTTAAIDLDGTDMVTFNPAAISPFEGAAGDTFEIAYSTLVGTAFVGGGGNLEFDITTLAEISAKVVYDFTEATPVAAVPVPAALPMMLGALGFAGFVARRRRG